MEILWKKIMWNDGWGRRRYIYDIIVWYDDVIMNHDGSVLLPSFDPRWFLLFLVMDGGWWRWITNYYYYCTYSYYLLVLLTRTTWWRLMDWWIDGLMDLWIDWQGYHKLTYIDTHHILSTCWSNHFLFFFEWTEFFTILRWRVKKGFAILLGLGNYFQIHTNDESEKATWESNISTSIVQYV